VAGKAAHAVSVYFAEVQIKQLRGEKVDIAVEIVERLIDYLKRGMASESGKTKLSGCHVVGNINTTSYRYT
jgi:hypothetical protein